MKRNVWLIKDPQREASLFRGRTLVAAVAAFMMMLTLIGRMYYLQILEHGHFTTLSQNNRVSVQPLAPTRGLIFDRNGVVLAENLPTFTLEIVRERVEDMAQTLDLIGSLITLTPDDLERFNKEVRRSRRFEPIPLRFRLSEEEVARIAVNRHRLPGVEINARLTRNYPLGAHTAHTVGYVGRISEDELKQIDASNYAATSHIGKVGIEKSHEVQLHGKVGYQQVETNARGRVLRVLERTPPVPGENLYLNIDIDLQQVAERAFGGERGALVAIEPQSGAVLSLVSVPTYDANLFVNGIDSKSYNALLHSSDRPLFNRALRGQYPPGSTSKPFVGLAGLDYRKIGAGDKVVCKGYYQLENDDHRYRDWKKTGHGSVDLNDAIVQSCDVFFYDLAFKLGIDNISTFLHRFGFGKPTGIDLEGEKGGLMPTREWKRRVRREPWFPGETLITGIGQGFSLATPLQLASATATLANRGRRLRPHMVEAVEDPLSGERTATQAELIEQVTLQSDGSWERIHRAMRQVVHGIRGTARRISAGIQYTMAGKTGTAQVFSIGQDEEYEAEEISKRLRDHALFIAFAPVDDPKIAVALIVENGGSGSGTAAPIARKVIDHYLLHSLRRKPDAP